MYLTKFMKMSIINRIITLALVAFVSLTVAAQVQPDIVKDINSGGNVTVNVPAGLMGRNNGDMGKQGAQARPAEEGVEKKETKTTYDDTPRRQHTTAQTVQGRKVGFRIQVLSDNSVNGKANAQARARAIAMKFPQYRTYISFNAPSWRLRIGDFKDQGEASAAMSRVRAAFPAFGGMSLVKDNVNIWSR